MRIRLSDLTGRNWRIAAVAISGVMYALTLILFFKSGGYQIFILSTVPVLAAAWILGIPGALVSTAIVSATHVILILFKDGSLTTWLSVEGGGLGTLATLIVGSLIGQISTLRNRIASQREVLLQTQDVTIFALAYEAELRDQATGRHLERTSAYVRMLAEELARSPLYHGYLTKEYISDLVRAAPLHDIGKVGVPDSILLKPGKLSSAEFSIMREHCDLGAQVLIKADERLQFQSFLKIAIQLAYGHHEKWDGSGYPVMLLNDGIPLSGRIMALADVYDALRSERHYKSAFNHSRCCEIVEADSGTHFDPELVNAFLRRHEDFHSVSIELADSEQLPELENLEVLETV